MPQNLIEKIVQKFTHGLKSNQLVRSGDYISIVPAYVMTHDNTGAVIPKFNSIGAEKFANKRQVVITLDHDIQNKEEKNLIKYKKIEEFANKFGADFYPAGRGIGHQIMCEEGYAWPGTLVVASDSHANMYGGLGCLGTPIVRTDASAIWATGRTWWQIPPAVKVELKGQLQEGVTGKDIIISLCGFFNNDDVLNYAIEFTGEGIKELSIDQRLTIANMTTEWGAIVGLFPIDEITINWLRNRVKYIEKRGLEGVASDIDGNGIHPRVNNNKISELEKELYNLTADQNAFYAKEISIDLSTIEPHVSGPNSVKIITPISQLSKQRIKIDKAYLVSCVNSRVDDLSEAAAILADKKISDGVKFYIGAASSEVQLESERRGDWQKLINAGAIPLPPGCGPCIGMGIGLLEDNEVGISATNRNFKGRMGSANSQAYLASPRIVAISAIKGFITDNKIYESKNILGDIKINSNFEENKTPIELLPEFPKTIKGELLYCYQDDLNTDGIFPGKHTYKDDLTPIQQAEVVMENYDPKFKNIVKNGDILVGGFNFGTGSSREQAATALKYSGIQLVIAGSFNETYKRNAINNGFLTLECPKLVYDLRNLFGTLELTKRTSIYVEIDFFQSIIKAEENNYSFSPVGIAAQELMILDGLENWVKNKLCN
jgi:homoaconitate hydratase